MQNCTNNDDVEACVHFAAKSKFQTWKSPFKHTKCTLYSISCAYLSIVIFSLTSCGGAGERSEEILLAGISCVSDKMAVGDFSRLEQGTETVIFKYGGI